MANGLKKALRMGAATLATVSLLAAGAADAFCGFYVAQADSKLFNQSSKVVLARDGDQTAITMASDYQGDARQFALVVPVPTVVERKQIGVVDMKTIDHLDAYSAPRLVEYSDFDPCEAVPVSRLLAAAAPSAALTEDAGPAAHGVTVEASYDVAEYDVLILSAQQSDGLVTWLHANGYKIPEGAEAVLGSYIKQKMHFFVAKVNLERMKLIDAGYLRPLQIRYDSPKFMLPLRLGTVNAKGPQDLIVFALTRRGRVEAVNYPNMKTPSDIEVPLYVKDDFGRFYRDLFARSVEKHGMGAIFTEYAWNMGFCDPCAAQPLSLEEQAELGARWVGGGAVNPAPSGPTPRRMVMPRGEVYLTRLHVRYDAASFPEDLALEETADTNSFQGRYVIRHPWRGEANCKAGREYLARLPQTFEQQAEHLADLTGWSRADIAARMRASDQPF